MIQKNPYYRTHQPAHGRKSLILQTRAKFVCAHRREGRASVSACQREKGKSAKLSTDDAWAAGLLPLVVSCCTSSCCFPCQPCLGGAVFLASFSLLLQKTGCRTFSARPVYVHTTLQANVILIHTRPIAIAGAKRKSTHKGRLSTTRMREMRARGDRLYLNSPAAELVLFRN